MISYPEIACGSSWEGLAEVFPKVTDFSARSSDNVFLLYEEAYRRWIDVGPQETQRGGLGGGLYGGEYSRSNVLGLDGARVPEKTSSDYG